MHPQMPTSPPVLPQATPPRGFAPFGGVAPPPVAPPPPPRGPRRWPIVVGIVVVIALLAALTVWLLSRDSEVTTASSPATTAPRTATTVPPGSAAPSTSAPSGAAPSTPPTSAAPRNVTPMAETPELTKAVDDAIAFIERTREAKFTSRPKVEVYADDDFTYLLGRLFDEDADAVRQAGDVFIALGLLEPGTDVVAEERSLLDAGVLGFYDPETKRLVVRGESLSMLAKVTIVHELTHALDDQLYNLNRPDLDKATDETGFGFQMLAEGSAKYVEDLYRGSLLPGEQDQLARDEAAMGLDQGSKLMRVPPVLLTLIQAPYSLGQPLVSDIVGRGGLSAIGPAFTKPPTTSEQGFEPSKYFSGEGAAAVAEPPADGQRVEAGTLGALVLDAMVSEELDQMLELAGKMTLDASVDGWAGDRYVTWKAGSAPCIRFDVKMDDAAERDALRSALDTWSQKVGGASVEDQGSDTVRATRCAGAAAESPA